MRSRLSRTALSGKPTTFEDSCLAGADVNLDLDEVGIDSKHGGAIRFEEHPKQTAFRAQRVTQNIDSSQLLCVARRIWPIAP